MTRPSAILHIGTEKTGSTALQDALALGRTALLDRNIVYSRAAGEHDHLRLAAYAADTALARRAFGATDISAFRADLERALATEIAQHPAATFVFSSEMLHSRLNRQQEVDRLAALLRPLFARVRVLVYLRRQDRVAVSRRSTRLKSGATEAATFLEDAGRRPYFNYHALLTRWERAFGHEAMTVRRYAPDALAGGSIVADFAAATGLAPLPEPATRANPSLAPAWQQLLAAMNARIPPTVDGRRNPERGALDVLVARLGAGRGARPARAAARAFQRQFREGNERVRARYFPDLDRLFDADFSDYPIAADADEPSRDDLYDAVAALWRAVGPRTG